MLSIDPSKLIFKRKPLFENTPVWEGFYEDELVIIKRVGVAAGEPLTCPLHPRVIAFDPEYYKGSYRSEGFVFHVYKYCGKDLFEQRHDLERDFNADGNSPLHPALVLKVINLLLGAIRTLEDWHRAELYHGDLKPENFCSISREDGQENVSIIDRDSIGPMGTFVTTHTPFYYYLSDEEAGFPGPILQNSFRDRYALGMTIYALTWLKKAMRLYNAQKQDFFRGHSTLPVLKKKEKLLENCKKVTHLVMTTRPPDLPHPYHAALICATELIDPKLPPRPLREYVTFINTHLQNWLSQYRLSIMRPFAEAADPATLPPSINNATATTTPIRRPDSNSDVRKVENPFHDRKKKTSVPPAKTKRACCVMM
jgi:hypothetical protein